ncbi:MAG: hypothetical protein JSU85_06995 [Candidatus Zixiibacteriota bacterium]|nr:MAG: hypothetical protein JSU85_06995 [candidate division Zixibacteria bacterium]
MLGLFVAVGSVAQGLDDKKIKTLWPSEAQCEILSAIPDVKIARFTPLSFSGDPGIIRSDDRKFAVCVDGYILTDKADTGDNLAEHIRLFANTCSGEGVSSGLGSIISGTYTLVIVDIIFSRCYVVNDHVGSLPLYYSKLDSGWLLSTNSVALARSGLIDNRIDLLACTEWAFAGSTIGDRYMLKGIKIAYPHTCFVWDSKTLTGRFEEKEKSPWDIVPSKQVPTVDQLADSFIEGCKRLSTIEPLPAHFQSSGKDSRLILAAWPDGYNPPCYTYGDPESLEVGIARSVAKIRGSEWVHVWLDGDEVAENLTNLFNASGMIIWPDRYFSARRMQKDGHAWVTDGYWGGVQTHPGGYDCDQYFSPFSRIARFATVFIDQKASAIGLDQIAETLTGYLLEAHHVHAYLDNFVSEDFIAELSSQKPQIKDDVYNELKRLIPTNDSLAILWRKYISSNRGLRQHAQQGVMCRSFINVLYPYCGDLKHHRVQLRVKPGVSAYDRQLIKLYRKRFPEYAAIPYGDSLLPLRVSAFRSRLSKMLISRSWNVPFLAGNTGGRARDANSWVVWLKKSRALRENAAGLIREGGIINEKGIANTFNDISTGKKSGTGQVFHLASIAKWISLSNKEIP